MKKIFISFVVLLSAIFGPIASAQWDAVLSGSGVTGGGGSFQTASDDFNYTNGAALGSQTNWTNVTTGSSLTVDVNGAAKGIRGTAAAVNSVVFYNQLTWSANQYAQSTVINVGGSTVNNGGIAVRCNATSGGNAYYIVYSGGTIYVNKINNGTDVGVTSLTQSLAVGNSLRLSVTGSGSSTRLTVSADTGSGFTIVSGGTSIDPGGTYLGAGSPGMASYDTASSQAQWGTFFAAEQ